MAYVPAVGRCILAAAVAAAEGEGIAGEHSVGIRMDSAAPAGDSGTASVVPTSAA